MLKEKIMYKDELHVDVLTANIIEYPTHFHDDPEVIYVLSGNITLKDGYYTYDLAEGDIFVLNDRDIHSIEDRDGDNMVMMLHLDMKYFSRYYDDFRDTFFSVDMQEDSRESVEVLRSILGRIMAEVLQKGQGYEHKVIESAHNLISCLMSDFGYTVENEAEGDSPRRSRRILSERLNRIVDYMYENYSRKLTLSEIAENEGLSIYYLSHIIKEATGLSFQDLLSYIRVEESEHMLLNTGRKMGAIAEETGFSAVRYYIKHFENWFGMHPLEYRKKYAGKTVTRESGARYRRCSPVDIEEAVRKQMKGMPAEYEESAGARPVIIDIDLEDTERHGDLSGDLSAMMKRGVNEILADPYEKFVQLGGEIIEEGADHMISATVKDGVVESMSILLYNFDENVIHSLKRIHTENDLLRVVRNFGDEVEFLVRCNGLSGDFKVLRYRLERDNFMMRLTSSIEGSEDESRRDDLIKRMLSAPGISTGTYTIADVLSIRATFRGVGAELILIDRI